MEDYQGAEEVTALRATGGGRGGGQDPRARGRSLSGTPGCLLRTARRSQRPRPGAKGPRRSVPSRRSPPGLRGRSPAWRARAGPPPLPGTRRGESVWARGAGEPGLRPGSAARGIRREDDITPPFIPGCGPQPGSHGARRPGAGRPEPTLATQSPEQFAGVIWAYETISQSAQWGVSCPGCVPNADVQIAGPAFVFSSAPCPRVPRRLPPKPP